MQERNLLNTFKDVLGRYCAINQFVLMRKEILVIII